jgi:hypothetical protein
MSILYIKIKILNNIMNNKEQFESRLESPYIWEKKFVFNDYITNNKNIIIIIIILLLMTGITTYVILKNHNKIK